MALTNGKNGYSNQTHKSNGISKKTYSYPYSKYRRSYANRFLGYERRFETAASSKELKNIDDGTFALAGNTLQPGNFQLANGIALGTDPDQRTGRQVDIRSIFLRIQILFSSTTNAADVVRLIALVDRQPNASASAPTTAELLEGGAGSGNVPRQLNLSNKDRFTILADRHYALSANGTRSIMDKVYIPCNLKSTFGSANNVPVTNAIYIFCATGTNDTLSQVTCYTRLRFADC